MEEHVHAAALPGLLDEAGCVVLVCRLVREGFVRVARGRSRRGRGRGRARTGHVAAARELGVGAGGLR
jgi:hypothetical protein